MNILNKIKSIAAKEVVGSVLKSGSAPAAGGATFGKKSKAAALLTAVAAIIMAVAEYL